MNTSNTSEVEISGYKGIWEKFVLGSLLATPFALWFLWRVAASTQQAARASLLSQLLSEYASDDMRTAMRELREWQHKYREAFVTKYIELQKSEDPDRYRL